MFIVIYYIVPCQFTANVLSRFKRKLTTAARMSEDLDELFLTPIPAPTSVELQQCILFGFRRRLNPAQILDECRSAFGPFAPSAQYVARWYQRFQDGLFTTDDSVEEDWGVGRGQTPTTCSDFNDDDNDDDADDEDADNANGNDNDNDQSQLPLVLHDLMGHGHSDKDSYNDPDDYYNDKADDELVDDGNVISYWHGYGYLGGKRRYATTCTRPKYSPLCTIN